MDSQRANRFLCRRLVGIALLSFLLFSWDRLAEAQPARPPQDTSLESGSPLRLQQAHLPNQCLFLPASSRLAAPALEHNPRSSAETHRIVLRFIIVRRSDGSGGMDESLLGLFMRDLNYGFRDTPFVFVQSPEIVYVDNDSLYQDIPNVATAHSILRMHQKAGVMNHVIAPSLIGNTTVTGINSASNPRGNVLDVDRIGQPHSIVFPPHEVGHVFFLYHPFEGRFGPDCTSGSSCAFRGDLICDTPASPIVHGLNTTATGTFFANIPGPCEGDPPYSPLTDLYMEAGWPAGHILRDRFTDGQVDRMLEILFSLSPDLIGPARPEVLVDCNSNGLDDVEEILSGQTADLGRDLVPDSCQNFPRPGDLLVSGMTSDVQNRVRYFDGQTGAYRDTMWNGMSWVHQLRMGPDGYVYLTTLNVVQRLDLSTGRTLDNFIDGGMPGTRVFVDLLFTDNRILLLDNISSAIYQFDAQSGEPLGVFANLAPSGMRGPKYMEYGPDGTILVVGNAQGGSTIQRVDAQTGVTLGSLIANGAGGLIAGQGLTLGPDGLLYVSNGGANNVLRFDPADGSFVDVFVPNGSGGLSNPHSLRFGPDGHLYVASRNDHSVKRYNGASGTFLGNFVEAGANGLNSPTGLFFVPAQTVFEHTFYFAQFGNGGPLTSDIVLLNPSPQNSANGQIKIRDSDGNLVSLSQLFAPSDGIGFRTTAEGFSLDPLGSVTFSTAGSDVEVVGSVSVGSDAPISGVIRFKIEGIGIAGVGSALPANGIVAPVRLEAGVKTGLAIRNVEEVEVHLDLQLFDQSGNPVANGSSELDLPANGHVSMFIDEFFHQADLTDFRGTVTATAQSGQIVAIALELGGEGEFTTLPVTPIGD